MFRQLVELRSGSKSAAGPVDASEKRKMASEAVEIATRLTAGLAGWAMHYLLGAQLSSAEDGRALEALGGALNGRVAAGDAQLSRAVRRDLCRTLLRTVRHSWPAALREELDDALLALDFGEQHELLTPEPTRSHGPGLTLLRLREQAVWIVDALQIAGMARFEAEIAVADCYGVSRESIRGWKRTVKQRWAGRTATLAQATGVPRAGRARALLFGKDKLGSSVQVARQMERARQYGAQYRRIKRASKGASR